MALKLVVHKVHPLSARQYETLMLYGDGFTYQEIADRLGLRYHTVKRHMEETRAKMKATSLNDAYRIVRRMQRNATSD